ncbi:RNA ligase cyclic nucleotide phosphodiesterase [Fusarium albosuccineum]|uniref:RNA ligase cyclic nucleotide phosphodiesterase n=1 Tax=Fusarium albosuccineum TaxID=1237068 RepID=A0A8H4LQC4_9HYPO|nr:RNA ligase cyclic nucleotide phosphodiesterase [Fusarium albosuccineum]
MTILSTPSAEPSSTPERPPYPIGVPFKFTPDGTVQRYPGNTTVCHIPISSPLIPGLHKVYTTLASHPTLAKVFRLLPPSSWHMTVFDGVREQECEPGMWPPDLAKQPLCEATADFSKRLREFGLSLEKEGLAPPYKIAVRGFDLPATVGVGLLVEGATREEEQRMRRLRDRLGDVLGFKAPNHETYRFHISIAYLLRHVDGDDRVELDRVLATLVPEVKMEFQLGKVEFCTFENMLAYPRLCYLGDEEGDSISLK